MITCSRKLAFSAGHRVLGHEGLCAYPHGHNYVVIVVATADQLDAVGRVIDFSVLKERLGQWLQHHWDHNFIVFEQDHEMLAALKMITSSREPYVAPFNPTAENMAHYLLTTICPEVFLDTGVKVVRVIVEETSNCSATAEA